MRVVCQGRKSSSATGLGETFASGTFTGTPVVTMVQAQASKDNANTVTVGGNVGGGVDGSSDANRTGIAMEPGEVQWYFANDLADLTLDVLADNDEVTFLGYA